MLFNSFEFVLVFLPVALAGYWLVGHSERLRVWFLVLVSIAFYGYWDIGFVPLLLASIGLNWLAAGLFARSDRKVVITAAIIGNLLVLGIFKYLGFFAEALAALTGGAPIAAALVLPLGISFFTFHHIIYLVDLRCGRAPHYSLRDYALYIALFPQILAGPLVRHSEIVHQFRLSPWRNGATERMGRGVILFVIGLAKKVFLADALAAKAVPVFAKADSAGLTTLEAWGGALAFTFQIYFDFSGYTDMAIGLALMLGMVLPQNFDAPYRAVSIQDFWRRWHMTLSRFLRDYLYVPLGGNRFGVGRQIAALLATMGLGGLWHGAGWTFVVWGLAHGVALGAGVLWRRSGVAMPTALGWVLTFLFVSVTWVLFRAETWADATGMLTAMGGATPLGSFDGWALLFSAAAVSILGPTSWQVSQSLKPRVWIAAGTAIASVALIFKLNGDTAYEFIYFQF